MPPWARRRRCSVALRTELPSTRLPCSALPIFPHALLGLGPLDLFQYSGTLFEVIFAAAHGGYSIYQYIYFVSRLRRVGLNVLGYLSHVPQRRHPACGHEASSHLTLSATEYFLIISQALFSVHPSLIPYPTLSYPFLSLFSLPCPSPSLSSSPFPYQFPPSPSGRRRVLRSKMLATCKGMAMPHLLSAKMIPRYRERNDSASSSNLPLS